MQEVTRCGVRPVLDHAVGLWESQSSQNRGKGYALESIGANGNGAEVLLPISLRLPCFVPFTWTRSLREAPCSWALAFSSLFISASWEIRSVRAWVLRNPPGKPGEQGCSLGAGMCMLHLLLTEDAYFLSHLRLKEEEHLLSPLICLVVCWVVFVPALWDAKSTFHGQGSWPSDLWVTV